MCTGVTWKKAEILTVQQDAAAFSFRAAITLACFFMAFQTRNVTSNFNESGFIFVCLCAEIVSTYFVFLVRNNLPTIQEKRMVELFSTVINQVIFSAFMFLPKIFFITFEYDLIQSRFSVAHQFSPGASRYSINVRSGKISRFGRPSTCVDQPGISPFTLSPYRVGSVASQLDVKTGCQTENGDVPVDAQKDKTENGDVPADAQKDKTENGDVPADAPKAFASQKLDDLLENAESECELSDALPLRH
jgi:hypothetical protein